jgi:hypothetical protein
MKDEYKTKPYLGEPFSFRTIDQKASRLYHDAGYPRPVAHYVILMNGFADGYPGIFFADMFGIDYIRGHWTYVWIGEKEQTREQLEEIAQQVLDLLRAAGEAE